MPPWFHIGRYADACRLAPRRIFTVFLMLYRVKGALIFGIFLTSIISWSRTTPVTAFPHTSDGDAAFDFFKQVVAFWPLKHIGNALDVRSFLKDVEMFH